MPHRIHDQKRRKGCMKKRCRPRCKIITIVLENLAAYYCTSTVWVKKNHPEVMTFFILFTNGRLRIFNRFFTHLLYVSIFARLQIFIQLYPTLTKLCHIKRDCLVHVICSKFPLSAETHAFRRLRKSLIALLIVVCGK